MTYRNVVRALLALSCCFALMAGANFAARAAEYPAKPVQLLVPWGAGGDSDAAMRIFAHFLTQELGQSVVVVNIPGAGGNLGNRQGKDAAPDGYTITMVHESVVTSPLVGMVDFTWKDFTPVANVCYAPMYLASRPDAPWNDVQGMLAWGKANPGKLTFGATLGSVSHFFPLDVAYRGNLDMKVIGYDGTAKRMQGLLGGFIDLGEVNPGTAGDLVSSGKLKMLGSASEERNPLTPEVPTLKEQGLPVYIGVTRGVVAPRGTPEPILARLEEACQKVCENPEYMKKIRDSGSVSHFRNRADYVKLLTDMTDHMTDLAKNLDVLSK